MDEQDPKIGPTYRYGDEKPFEFALGDSENIERISQHIEQHVGKVTSVFHELISDKVHIDVHQVAPTPARPYYTLVTSGMSDRAMRPPEGYEDCAFAELAICLPPDWKMTQKEWDDSANYWPIHALKFLARFPHQHETWLWDGHTIPNGDPPEPVDASTALTGFILYHPLKLTGEFERLRIDEKKTIRFLTLVPLHTDEMAFKLKHGADALRAKLKTAGVSELLDPKRPSVMGTCGSGGGFWSRLFGR